MYDLIVIGGGFWGTACAVLGRERGLGVLLLDDLNAQGASRNAAGIITLDWYRSQTVTKIINGIFTMQDAAYGLKWLLERGLARHTGEEFYPLWGEHRFRQDCHLTNPARILELGAPQYAKVTKLERTRGYWTVDTQETFYEARMVILAAGAFTDELLAASNLSPVGVKPLRGRALLLKAAKHFDVPFTAQVAPYTHYTIRPWEKGMLRLGDTVEKLTNTASALDHITRFGQEVLPDMEIVGRMDGLRPVAEKMIVREVTTGLVVATGGHRVGLALAPAAARKALFLLGVDDALV